jgi:hypothetical protein
MTPSWGLDPKLVGYLCPISQEGIEMPIVGHKSTISHSLFSGEPIGLRAGRGYLVSSALHRKVARADEWNSFENCRS